MRVLLTTRGSSGHVLPLAAFGHAALRAGHDVLVASQRRHAGNVRRAGLAVAGTGDPPDHAWMPLMADFATLDLDVAHARMVRDFFGRLDTESALPGLRAIVDAWRPDVIIRETWEFASTLVAEERSIPLARVGLGLAALEEESAELAAPALDELRAQLGLSSDPAGERLREGPYLTTVPALLDLGTAPAWTRRFAHPRSATAAPPLPSGWWPDNGDPLVYLSFGTVAAGAHLPYFPALYRAALQELADLPVRVLLTIGDERDPAELGPLPRNVHVERWVAQDAVLPHAAATVSHGGYGSTLGALGHGVPLVVLPLFSADQWANAAAVARAGAGIALDGDRATRRAVELPEPAVLGGIGPAVQRVLAEPGHRLAAQRIAQAMRALPPVDAALDELSALAGAVARAA